MPECCDATPGILQHCNTVAAQTFRGGPVDGGWHRRQYGDRRFGACRNLDDGIGVGGVTVEFADQIDGQCGHRNRGIVDDRLQTAVEQGPGVGTGAPQVQRIGGDQPLVEQIGDGGQRGVAQFGELDPEIVCEIGTQRPFSPGVVNGGDPDRTRPASTAGLEKLDGVA